MYNKKQRLISLAAAKQMKQILIFIYFLNFNMSYCYAIPEIIWTKYSHKITGFKKRTKLI